MVGPESIQDTFDQWRVKRLGKVRMREESLSVVTVRRSLKELKPSEVARSQDADAKPCDG